jgi:5'-deoxynucleotidase
MNIKTLMRVSHVRRWHIVAVDREQSVAEHTCRVQLLAAEICRRHTPNPVMMFKTVRWALWHDLPEVVVGDIPTPTKKCVNVDALEMASSGEYRTVLELTSPTVLRIVKAADLIEAALYMEEYGRGAHAKEVYAGILKDLDAFVGDAVDVHVADVRGEVLNGWS